MVASQAAPYAWGPKIAAAALCAAGRWLPLDAGIGALQLLLWALSAGLLYRLVREATGESLAGFIACLLVGASAPLTQVDTAYSLQHLDRSLGQPALLWGIWSLVRGEPWAALFATAAATYLHPNPAIYLWPLLLLEDFSAAWRGERPLARALARAAAAAALAAPFVASALGGPPGALPEEYRRLGVFMFRGWIDGLNAAPSDVLFTLGGLALFAAAFPAFRSRPAAGLASRALALSLSLAGAGSLAYAWGGGSSWGALLSKYQPWTGLYLVEIFGQIVVSAWLARSIREDGRFWPLGLLLLGSAASHDLVQRGCLVGLALSGRLRRPRWSAGFAALTPVPGLAGALAPEALSSAARAIGLRGGLLRLPAFDGSFAAAALAALAVPAALLRVAPRRRAAAAGLAAALIMTGPLLLRERPPEDAELAGLAHWIADNTPPDAVILFSPIDVALCGPFLAESRRSVFACQEWQNGAMLFGARSAPMFERLRAAGFSAQRALAQGDTALEYRRIARDASSERLSALARRHGVGYLLSREERVGFPLVRRQGPYRLYALPGPGS